MRSDARGTIRSRVVICDARDRYVRTVARAEARGNRTSLVNFQRARGTIIWAASLAGRRVAWAEGTAGRRGGVSRIKVADARTGRVLSTRTIWRTAGSRLPRLAVALSARGDLAWTGPPRPGDHANRVIVRPAGQRARPIDDDADELGFEDRGTLRITGENGIRYHELRPPLVRGGCPVRTAFSTALDSQGILVTSASYADPGVLDVYYDVLRVCLRGEGTDRILTTDPQGSPVLAAPPYVLLASSEGKYCQGVFALTLVDVRTLQPVKRAGLDCAKLIDPALEGDTVTWSDPAKGRQSVVLR